MAVPTLRKQHVEATHTFVPCDNVEIGPVQNIAHMQVARWVRRWRVDGERLPCGVGPVEAISAHLFPFLLPFALYFCEVVFLGEGLHFQFVSMNGFYVDKMPDWV